MHMNKFVQIRNMSEGLHRKLKIRAAQKDMSITDYVTNLIERDVEKPTLAEMSERLKKLPSSNISTDEIVAIIRESRDAK